MVPQPAWSVASSTRHVPAAGAATSAYQKYGGPPCRSRDLMATLPFGAISESSPESGFSTAKITRSGAPFQGATGDGSTATSAASSQVAAVARDDGPCACATEPSVKHKQRPPAISNDAVATEAAIWRAGFT